MRITFALPGLHRVDRGAEVAFIAIARELARAGHDVTMIGSGEPRQGEPYHFIRAKACTRDHFARLPSLPALRDDTAWEDLTFAPGLWKAYQPQRCDLAVTCSFPFTHWVLRAKAARYRLPVRQIFVTQNGDWPARSDTSEYRFFACDGLVCTNPDYFENNRSRFRSALIPNGVDLERFRPGQGDRSQFGIPADRPVVLMVSAFIPSKNIASGIEAISQVPDATLVVAGDGPLRDELAALAQRRIPGRYRRVSVASELMPHLYRCANAFLHLSTTEPFGNVYIEAMASGLPIVAYDQPRTRWIVGPAAFYCDSDAPETLPRTINAALMSGKQMSVRLHERSRDFAWSKIGTEYAGFFERIIAECRPRPRSLVRHSR